MTGSVARKKEEKGKKKREERGIYLDRGRRFEFKTCIAVAENGA
jgi:hypothetical protein